MSAPTVECPLCQGSGKVLDGKRCPRCKGTGRIPAMRVRLHTRGRCVGVEVQGVLFTHNMTMADFDAEVWPLVLRRDVPSRLEGFMAAAIRRAGRPT